MEGTNQSGPRELNRILRRRRAATTWVENMQLGEIRKIAKAVGEPARIFQSIRPKNLKRLLLLRASGPIHDVSQVMEALGCSRSTAYDYLRALKLLDTYQLGQRGQPDRRLPYAP